MNDSKKGGDFLRLESLVACPLCFYLMKDACLSNASAQSFAVRKHHSITNFSSENQQSGKLQLCCNCFSRGFICI